MIFQSELESWLGTDVQEWRALWGLPDLRILGLTGSTNDDVKLLAEQGAPELTVVIANQQTAGRGQHGRTWGGVPGKSLHLSALLRPVSSFCLPAAPVRIGIHVAKQLARLGADLSIKWPNDLVIRDRKLGGVLCEGIAGVRTYMVAGIGINVGHEEHDFAPNLRASATSLRREGLDCTVAAVAGAVIDALRECAPRMGHALSADELRELEQRDALRERAITVDGIPAGIARGTDEGGALRVEHDGILRFIRTGTVRAVESGR